MKRNLNKKLIAISLFIILILSLGIASASNVDDSNYYPIDAYIDSPIGSSIDNSIDDSIDDSIPSMIS